MAQRESKPSLVPWTIVIVACVAIDQATKTLAYRIVPGNRSPNDAGLKLDQYCVIPHIFYLSPNYNKGGGWGLLNDVAGARYWLIALASLALVFIRSLALKAAAGNQRFLMGGLALVAGGAVGNVLDRIVFGAARTFAQFGDGKSLPITSLADACILGGVLVMALDMFRTRASRIERS